MEKPLPRPTPIQVGRILLEQHEPGAVVLIHRGKAGEIRVVVPASQLEQWARRKLRDGAFA